VGSAYPGLQAAIEGLLAEFGRDWGRPREARVDDFGYPEVSVFTDEDHCAFVNLPHPPPSVNEHPHLGVLVDQGADGILEFVTLGERSLEISFADGSGRLLPPTDPAVRRRVLETVSAAERKALAADHGMFLWADGRLRAVGAGEDRYSYRLPPLLVGDPQASAIAGVPQDVWDAFAAVHAAHFRFVDSDRLLEAFLRCQERGIAVSPDALLLLTVNTWNVRTEADFRGARALPDGRATAAMEELVSVGLLEWPTSVRRALLEENMDVLRSMFGPLGIKAQGKTALIDRAFAALSEDKIRGLAAEGGVDLSRPMFSESVNDVLPDWSTRDPRPNRINQLAERRSQRMRPAGVPEAADDDGDDFLFFAPSESGDEVDEEPFPDADVEALAAAAAETIEIAQTLLARTDTKRAAGELAANVVAALAALLAGALPK